MWAFALSTVVLPTLYVALLPALADVGWGDGDFAAHHHEWTVSHMIRTPQANGLFALAMGSILHYAWSSPTRRAIAGPAAAASRAGLSLAFVALCVVVAVPVGTLDDGVHMVGVGLGGAGLATVLVSVAVAQRWRAELAWAFLCIAPIVATTVSRPCDSVGFFVAEVAATFEASLFFPLLDLARSGVRVVIAVG